MTNLIKEVKVLTVFPWVSDIKVEIDKGEKISKMKEMEKKMRKRQDKYYSFLIGSWLSGVAVFLIFLLVVKSEVSLGIQQAVMVIIGLMILGALNAFGSGLEDTDAESLILNKTLVDRSLNIQQDYPVKRQNLAEVAETAEEIQQLLDQLSQTNPTTTTREKMTVVAEAVDQIENNLTLKEKVINVLKAGEVEVLKEAIDNPLTSILMATIEGWRESDEYIGIRD